MHTHAGARVHQTLIEAGYDTPESRLQVMATIRCVLDLPHVEGQMQSMFGKDGGRAATVLLRAALHEAGVFV